MPSREFCALKRSSVRPALGKLPGIRYGSEEKLVPIPLPMPGERKTFVKSMKPRGVKVALPILKKSGEGGSPPFPCWGCAAGLEADEDEDGPSQAAAVAPASAVAVADGVLPELVDALAALALAAAAVLSAALAASAGEATKL